MARVKESEEIHRILQERKLAAGFVKSKDVCQNCKYYEIWAEGCGYSESQRCVHPDFLAKAFIDDPDFGYAIAPYTTDTGWCENYERE